MKRWSVLIGMICCAVIGWNFISKKKPTPLQWQLPNYVAHAFHSPNFPQTDNNTTIEGFELGRKLFYDTQLSVTKTISCASCHIQTFAFSDTAKFSKGIYQRAGERNSMSLVNIGWSSKFFWDGRAANLREQIHDPIIDAREMGNTWGDVINYVRNQEHYRKDFKQAFPKERIGEITIKKAIEQFVSNIYAFNTRYDDYFYNSNRSHFSAQEKEGLRLFNGKAQCGSCHNTVLFTNHQFLNNGLDSTPSMGLFNATGISSNKGLQKVPSLRNVALTAPYMHDGRFATLEAVLDFYNHQVQANSPNLDFRMAPFIQPNGLGLSTSEKQAIIAFLQTLTDSSLLIDKRYHNPWTTP
jgi:cytochrome c peroxidase